MNPKLIILLALLAGIVGGIIAVALNLRADSTDPAWSNGYTVATLQVGTDYDFPVAPTADQCNSATLKDRHKLTATATGGRTQARDTDSYGFREHYEQGRVSVANDGHRGPLLGLSLVVRDNGLNVVGRPLSTATRIPIHGWRYCLFDNGQQWSMGDTLYLTIEGDAEHGASTHSVAHGHIHHDDYAPAALADRVAEIEGFIRAVCAVSGGDAEDGWNSGWRWCEDVPPAPPAVPPDETPATPPAEDESEAAETDPEDSTETE